MAKPADFYRHWVPGGGTHKGSILFNSYSRKIQYYPSVSFLKMTQSFLNGTEALNSKNIGAQLWNM